MKTVTPPPWRSLSLQASENDGIRSSSLRMVLFSQVSQRHIIWGLCCDARSLSSSIFGWILLQLVYRREILLSFGEGA